MAVDGKHIYWANLGTHSIARANLDGTEVDIHFIDGVVYPQGVAVTPHYVYWSETETTIGRASLDGSNIDREFVTGAESPDLMDRYRGFLYWSNQHGGSIGRASLKGTPRQPDFIAGATKPLGVAVDASGIYWADNGTGTVGHANLDGSAVKPSYITEARAPIGIAIDAGADTTPPQTRITNRPRHKAKVDHVRFKFRSSEKRSTFRCRLDKKKWRSCTSPKKYKHLDPGRHVFKVRATDTAGNVDPTPARAKFKVIAS